MRAKITVETESSERTYECAGFLTIGRVEDNDIAIIDPEVSRNHAAIRTLGDGRHYVADMGSANGTFLNSTRVVSTTQLNDGDKIIIGGSLLTYRCAADSETTAAASHDEMLQATMVAVDHKILELTILVSDIRNYSVLSERASEDLLAAVMGDWCRAVSRVADKNCGVIDKFIGDAVMIRWLTVSSSVEDSVTAALKTASDINAITQQINLKYDDLPAPLGVGAGVNTGKAILGNVGGSIGRDYTAIGDAVNLAFRIESATRELGLDLLLAKDSYKHLPESLWRGKEHEIKVKGKSEPVQVCALNFSDLDVAIENAE